MKHSQLFIILSMCYFYFQAQIIIDAIVERFEVSVNLRQRAGSAKKQIPSNSSNVTDCRTIN